MHLRFKELPDSTKILQVATYEDGPWHDVPLVKHEKRAEISATQISVAVAAVREQMDLYPPAQKTRAIGDDAPTWQAFAFNMAKYLGL